MLSGDVSALWFSFTTSLAYPTLPLASADLDSVDDSLAMLFSVDAFSVPAPCCVSIQRHDCGNVLLNTALHVKNR